MRFPGFVGPSYTSRSRSVDAEETINYYSEFVESGEGEAPVVLYRVPGKKLFLTLPDQPLRGLISGHNRLFAAAGQTLFEIFANRTYATLGIIQQATTPVQAFQNGEQLLVISGAQGYLDNGISLQPVVPAVMGAYIDTYFLVKSAWESQQFQISAPGDGTSWDPLDIGFKEGGADRLVAIADLTERLWLLGEFTSEVWWDSGNNNFPFERVQDAVIALGLGAPWSVAKLPGLDGAPDMLAGLSLRPEGGRQVWLLGPGGPQRISSFAVETALQGYPICSDAVGYWYQDQGHWFYVLSLPTADMTWVYDYTTSQQLRKPEWTKRLRWDTQRGVYHADRARFHAYQFDQHFVGGGDGTGNIYTQSIAYPDDAGVPIRRLRASPHSHDEFKRITYHEYRLDMNVGDGPQGFEPTMVLQNSDDGGFTWLDEQPRSAAPVGQRKWQVQWNIQGMARERAVRTICTDPINECLNDLYMRVTEEVVPPGTN